MPLEWQGILGLIVLALAFIGLVVGIARRHRGK